MSDYFANVKMKDRVFNTNLLMFGNVSRLTNDEFFVDWDDGQTDSYSYDGKWGGITENQTLFYADEVEFVIKPRKRMVKKECVRYCNRPPSDLANGSYLDSCFAPHDNCQLKVTMTWEEYE